LTASAPAHAAKFSLPSSTDAITATAAGRFALISSQSVRALCALPSIFAAVSSMPSTLELLRESEKLTADAAAELKSAPAEIAHRAAALQSLCRRQFDAVYRDGAVGKRCQHILRQLGVGSVQLAVQLLDFALQCRRAVCDLCRCALQLGSGVCRPLLALKG